MWQARLYTVRALLAKNISVFVADTDTIWTRYMSLSTLPTGFDAYQSKVFKKPRWAVKRWGFAICGCNAGYRPTKNAVKLIDTILKRCNACDDQEKINQIYAMKRLYDIQFSNQTKPKLRGPWRNSTLAVNGEHAVNQLELLIFDEHLVVRGGEVKDCGQSWIIHPISYHQRVNKLASFEKFRECMKVNF